MGKTRRKKRKPYGTLRKSRRYKRKGGQRRTRRSIKRRRVKHGGYTLKNAHQATMHTSSRPALHANVR